MAARNRHRNVTTALWIGALAGMCGGMGTAHAQISNGPTTPDRPGRGDVTDVLNLSDQEFLHETAATLGVANRPDLELLRWYGLRPQLEAAGLSIDASVTADWSHNFTGGIKSGDVFRHLLDVGCSSDS